MCTAMIVRMAVVRFDMNLAEHEAKLQTIQNDIQIAYCSDIINAAAHLKHDKLRNHIFKVVGEYRQELTNVRNVAITQTMEPKLQTFVLNG